MAPRPAVDGVVHRVVEAYRRSGAMSFCYGQGSVLSGFTVADQSGEAHRARDQLETFPAALLDKAHLALDKEWPGIRSELEKCARQSDGWLFHLMLGDALRITYIAWFAAHSRYCPFPKRIPAWGRRFGFDPDLLDLEQRIWHTPSLGERLVAITGLVDGVLRSGRAG